MDTMIYHLIGLTTAFTFLLVMGWSNVLKIVSATALTFSPFVLAGVFLAQSGVLTL